VSALTAQEASVKASDAIAQRDAIQANLLELDGSFGKRLLDGAALSGQTGQRWEKASAALADLWQTFSTYSAVVDRVTELAQGNRRPSPRDLAELGEALTERSVKLARAPAPLARRDLADSGRRDLTLAGAVTAMRRAFSEVTEVTAAAEVVWTEAAGRLDAVRERLAGARAMFAGLEDDGLAARLRDAEATLESQRTALNSDPLALWRDGHADMSAADGLARQAADVAEAIAGLDRVRREAQDRIARLRAATEAARAARQDTAVGWQRAAQRVTAVPPFPPEVADPPLASLAALAAECRWSRLGAELDRCEAEVAAATAHIRDTERTAATLLARRDELRGLLGAYKAKAARLGSAEDEDLAARYDHAYDLLWTAPCDLAAAADAVTGYQQAILAMEGQRR
jgi:hypothetical protein